MLTLEQLKAAKILRDLKSMPLSDEEGCVAQTSLLRCFYYTKEWAECVERLPWGRRRGTIGRNLSERGRIMGAVYDFAEGVPLSQFPRAVGTTMDPPFKRMQPRPPYTDGLENIGRVAYLRTDETRTFGFFGGVNVFVAVCMRSTAVLKTTPREKGLQEYAVCGKRVIALIRRLKSDQVDAVSDFDRLVSG